VPERSAPDRRYSRPAQRYWGLRPDVPAPDRCRAEAPVGHLLAVLDRDAPVGQRDLGAGRRVGRVAEPHAGGQDVLERDLQVVGGLATGTAAAEDGRLYDWQRAAASGEEAVGGTVSTPDQDRVENLGNAVGV
jgi:hypothetical protein